MDFGLYDAEEHAQFHGSGAAVRYVRLATNLSRVASCPQKSTTVFDHMLLSPVHTGDYSRQCGQGFKGLPRNWAENCTASCITSV